jgi:putative ABC transport system ATP-binding protein
VVGVSALGLSVSDLGVQVGTPRRALWQGVSFQVASGKAVAVTGPSGSGKSTLMSALAGFGRPAGGRTTSMSAEIAQLRGRIIFDGVDVVQLRGRRHREFLRRSCAFAPQCDLLMPELTVGENLDVLRPWSSTRRSFDGVVARALERTGMTGRAGDLVGLLSGGERSRVALARVLLRPAALVLLDEPTAALDPAAREAVLDVLGELRAQGATLVIATHDLAVAAWTDDRVDLTGATVHGGEAAPRRPSSL